jgi:hypothetical protein
MRMFSFVTLLVTVAVLGACTFKEAAQTNAIHLGSGTGATYGGGFGGRGLLSGSGGSGPCMGLRCQQSSCMGEGCTVAACSGTDKTTVTGTVYDPAGKVPLYNVTVYVPNAPLTPLPEGAACLLCDTALSGSPIVQANTDSAGHFVLENVPSGANIPLVIQVGKWRRQITLPSVSPCVANALTDPNLTRLPRNQAEGNLPRIAITTGALDALECLLRKIGIDDSEFTMETGTGRVNLYSGGNTTNAQGIGTSQYTPTLNGGATFTRASGWWDDVNNLKHYDIVLHSCEGIPMSINKSPAALQAFQDYANMGGRIFASHWHNYWLENPPNGPLRQVAAFHHLGDPVSPFTSTIDVGFPKGADFAQWLLNVGASTTLGQLIINGAKHTVDAVRGPSQRWIYATNPDSVQYFSFNTPLDPAAPKCGKVVFSDLHVSSGSGMVGVDDLSKPEYPFPTGCVTTALSPQEKALEFMLFDLSACLREGIP